MQPWQKQVKAERARFNVVCIGRQAGKTVLGEDLASDTALEGLPAAFMAPTYKAMRDSWHALRDRLEPVTERASVSEQRIELVTGGRVELWRVELWSLDNPDAARGRKYARIVVDEAAQIPRLVDVFNKVLRPMLAVLGGDAWFLSTPFGMNDFWQLYQYGLDPAMTDWRCWQMPSSVSSYFPESEMHNAEQTMLERAFQQEHLAQFLEDGGVVFRNFRNCVSDDIPEGVQDGHEYVIGVDWGKHEDFTVLVVVDTVGGYVVGVERFNRIDYSLQRARLADLCARFAPLSVIAERNSMGEPIIEELQRDGLPVRPFTTTNASKAQAIEALALAFEQGAITIPNDPVLIGELQAFSAKRLPSGMLRYEAPAGMHDDCVMALALAWHGGARVLDGPLMA